MKALLIVGTRPEAIKMVSVFKALKENKDISASLLLTGQHREMARSVLGLFGIVADIDLDLMQPGQTLLGISSLLTQRLITFVEDERPDVIVVQGDTTSAMIGAWIGFYAGCRVAHVEAGLRTGNLAAPYPEEFNRRVISLAAHWHFAPTEVAAENLRREGITHNVHVVGNTVIDAALEITRIETPGARALVKNLPFLQDSTRRTVLVTAHRRENFGGPMQSIGSAVAAIADRFSDVDILLPLHPNPAVAATLRPIVDGRANIHVAAPLQYDELIRVIKSASLILSDSGGIQEEAPTFGTPVLVLRNETERMEGVNAGCARLVGTDRAKIISEATRLLTDPDAYSRMAKASNPYGDGQSSSRIAAIIAGAEV